jgi:hypothetical protein
MRKLDPVRATTTEVYTAADLEGIERPNDHSLLFYENPFTAMREDLGFRIWDLGFRI